MNKCPLCNGDLVYIAQYLTHINCTECFNFHCKAKNNEIIYYNVICNNLKYRISSSLSRSCTEIWEILSQNHQIRIVGYNVFYPMPNTKENFDKLIEKLLKLSNFS